MSNFLDLVETGGQPPTGGAATTRIARVSGQLQYSADGFPWAPLARAIALPFIGPAGTLNVGDLKIPSLQAWYDMSRPGAVALSAWTSGSASPAGAISDLSGLGSRDLTAVGTPKLVTNSIGGMPAIAVEPSTPSYYQNTSVNLIATDRNERTVFMVGIARSTQAGAFFQFRTGATGLFNFEFRNNGSALVYGGTGIGLGTFPPAVQVLNTPHIYEYSYDARGTGVSSLQPAAALDSCIRVIIDGAQQPVSAAMGNVENGTTGFALGTRTDATNVGWNGEIAEVLVFNKDLSARERRAVRTYLSAKYSIGIRNPVMVMWFGDSHFYGQGDATTLAAGGPRQEVHAGRPHWMSKGSQYAPATGAYPGDGLFNYTDGYQAATSDKTGAAFTGGSGGVVEFMRACKPDLIMFMIGTNDPLLGINNPATTAQNVLDTINYIGAVSPDTRVVVMRALLLGTTHASAGTANPIITAQGPALQAALTPSAAPNVLVSPQFGNVIIPTTQPNSLYAEGVNPTHLLPAGWHQVITQNINPFLTSVGY